MTTEHTEAIARRFIDEVVSDGSLDIIDEPCSQDQRLHATLSGPDALDRDRLTDLVGSFRSSSRDARITIEDIVTEGDLVAARLRDGGPTPALSGRSRPRASR